MDSKETSDKEKLVEALHNKGKLPTLRSYQGDVASFIQSKDQSVAEIALKNKEVKERKEVETKRENAFLPKDAVGGGSIFKRDTTTNFVIYFLGAVLLISGVGSIGYVVFINFKNKPTKVDVPQSEIIRNNKTVSIDSSSLSNRTFGQTVALAKANPEYKGSVVSIDMGVSAPDLVNKLGWRMPDPLKRNLENDFMAGLKDVGVSPEFFIIFKVKDYGIAFRDMLSWERDMETDLGPSLNVSLSSTTSYVWRDLIVKNKDSRGLVSNNGKVALIYTFLDQKTILVTESEATLSSITNSFFTGNVLR